MNHSDILQSLSTAIINTHDYTLIGRWNRLNKTCHYLTREKMGTGYTSQEARRVLTDVIQLLKHIDKFNNNRPKESHYLRAVHSIDFMYFYVMQNIQYIRLLDKLLLVTAMKLVDFFTDIAVGTIFIQYSSGSINPLKTLIYCAANYNRIREVVLRYGEYLDLVELNLFALSEKEMEQMEWSQLMMQELPF